MKAMFPGWNGQTNEPQIHEADIDVENGKVDIESEDEESVDWDSTTSVSSIDSTTSVTTSVSSIISVSDEESDTSSDDVPTKRARKSLPNHQHDAASDASLELTELSSTKKGDDSALERQLKIHMDRSRSCFNMLKSSKKRKIDALNNELKSAKKSKADLEAKYNELMLKYDAANAEISKVKLENSEQKTKMADEMQAVKDDKDKMVQNLRAKFKQIVENLAQKSSQDYTKCQSCGKALKFCDSVCEESW